MDGHAPAIVGTGSRLPDTVRRNDDPIFDWLHQHTPPGTDLFKGYDERRVLADGESVVDLLVPAATQALERADRTVAEVDLVIGYASIGTWACPNDLAAAAGRLGVSPKANIVPLNDEYSTFNQGLVLADSLLRAGRARTALVLAGSNWTRYVDYHTAPAVSAGDGAGAAVVAASSDPAHFRVRGNAVEFAHEYWGGMYVAADEVRTGAERLFSAPVFHITDLGIRAFTEFGLSRPPAVAAALLSEHHIEPSSTAWVSYQSSSLLLDAWRTSLRPGRFIETLATYGNMTTATLAVNFDFAHGALTEDIVLLVALGPEVSANVVLLSRSSD